MIFNLLSSPLTLVGKLFDKDDTKIYGIIFVVIWLLMVLVSWVIVGPTAKLIFKVITSVVGYALSIFFYLKADKISPEFLPSEFVVFLIASAIAGYTFGLLGYYFFLLY